jgi:hypothetical protein
MSHDELVSLLTRARRVLERYVYEPGGDMIRDDVAEVCMAIDDAVPEDPHGLLHNHQPKRSAA